MKDRKKIIIIITLFLFIIAVSTASFALKLPEKDANGSTIIEHPTAEQTNKQHFTIIYLLITLLAISIMLNIFLAFAIYRFQASLRLINEAIKRVDILSVAVKETSHAWSNQTYTKSVESQNGQLPDTTRGGTGESPAIDTDNLSEMFKRGVESQFSED